MPRLKQRYDNEVIAALKKRFSLENIMQVPRLEKVVVNMGVGKAIQEPKLLDEAVACLSNITGQKPVVTRARKAISNFKLRANLAIGCMVTLRGDHMYEFIDRMISITIPRIRDFKGLSRKSFDGFGNYTLGVTENIVFMEVDRDKISRIMGMDVCICTTAKNNELALGLLEELGMPFKR
ncbi:MAG: 50S ribosomal protein L5 [Chitinivibrionales bacterium]|nr:50S ribosomal protein L5 [Chitinivibrionales bacterium]